MRHYLVVANQTLKQPELTEKIRTCIEAGPCDFFLLVPATRTHGPVRWTPADAFAVARRRLESALERFRALGADVVGDVGDPSPVVAIGEVLRRRSFDALILSTLPVGPSQWLRGDVPARIEQFFGIPVDLVTPPVELEVDLSAAEAVIATAPGPQHVQEAVAAP
jgi:GABA permease